MIQFVVSLSLSLSLFLSFRRLISAFVETLLFLLLVFFFILPQTSMSFQVAF